MEHLRWIGFGVFFAASLYVGLRLLWLSRRTGQLPELLLGIGILGVGPLGFGLSMAAFTLVGTNSVLAATLRGSSQLAAFMGAASQFIFTWYVFRRRSLAVTVFVHVAIAALAVAYATDIHETGLLRRELRGDAYWAGFGLRLAGLAWAVFECTALASRLRRRAAVGVQDPGAASQLGFWALGMGLALAGAGLGGAMWALTGQSITHSAGASLVQSLWGLSSTLCLWRAFWPELRLAGVAPRAPEPLPSRFD